MTSLATTADVAAIAGPVPSADEARVELLIELVSAPIVRHLPEVSFTAVADATVILRPTDGVLIVPRWPVTAVTSVTVGSTLQDPADYTFSEAGIFTLVDPDDRWADVQTTIVYDYGFATPAGRPDDLALVVAEIVAVKWLGGTHRVEGVSSEAIESYKVSFYTTAPAGVWLPEHQGIIDAYRTPVIG
jgi:hypothetical protein